MSLIEVAIAIAVTSVILLSLLLMFTRGMFVLSHSKQVDRATELAQHCIETIRANGPAAITLGRYDSRAGDAPDGGTGFPPFPYNPLPTDLPLVVNATTTGVPAGLIAVEVEVYYEANQKVRLQTYIGN